MGCTLYLEMWTDTPADNLLTKHTAHEIKTIQCCKQGYIFNTPAHFGGVKELECQNKKCDFTIFMA